MDFTKAIEIKEHIFWVGEYFKNDPFQCHPYLIENGDESILIDPGSIIEFDAVIKKVASVTALRNIKYIILHHQDPDICASVPMIEKLLERSDLQIITHSRIKVLVKHYCITSNYYEIDKEDLKLRTSSGLELQFLTTPYCHSPGAFVTYEPRSKVLFSSDIFGGMSESWNFFAGENYFEEIRAFHSQYMPSRDILNYSLEKIEKLDIEFITPQHGSIIKKEFIQPLIEKMKNLDCGLYIEDKYNKELTTSKEKENFLHTVIESNNSAIIAINKDQVIQIFNRSAQEMFGFTHEEMVGKDALEKIIPPSYWQLHRRAVSHFIETKCSIGVIGGYHNLRATRKSGEEFPIRIGFGVTFVGKGMVIVANITDRTMEEQQNNKLQQQNDALTHQAHHDALTGLPNRLLFFDRLHQAIKKARRTQTMTAVLFLDLDYFKEINDSLGHGVGDKVLIEIARRLKIAVRSADTIARLGGDEFTIIIESIKNLEDIVDIASKLLTQFQKPLHIYEHEFYITCSIGISVFPNDGESPETLLRDADSAMYKAKEEGRNSYRFYTADMTERALERVWIETHLRRALENKELIVYYQLQYNAVLENIVGMEALVRWNNPEKGMIPPVKFIPLAEETGLIVMIDRWVMQIAMKQIVIWHKQGLNPGRIALNLSIKHLQAEDFIEKLHTMLDETQCKAEYIELEVTEGQVMKNPEQAIGTLQEVSDFGIELAIDDFGTGYSSLAYLKRLPVNRLKIDRSFIQGIPDDDEDAAIVKAVIAMSESMKLSVIAEGVETVEQKEFLIQNGCSSIQGFLFGKPMPAEEMEMFLRTFKKSGIKSGD